MNKEERVLRTIARKEIDYLPSQIEFSNRAKMQETAEGLGLSSLEELMKYLENHIYITSDWTNMPLLFRGVADRMDLAEKLGYATIDRERGIVYDRWGMGVQVSAPGFFVCHNPMRGKFNEETVRKFKTPEFKPDEFDFAVNELKQHSGEYLVLTSGYIGIFERGENMVGIEEFLYNMAAEPLLVEEFLDKITEYRVELAKKTVAAGFKIGHYGDDLGGQCAPLISPAMFRRFLKPRIAQIFKVYKDAGLPVLMHCCGWVTAFIPDLIEIGLDVLEPVQPVMDLAFLKREYGKDLTFMGGIDTQMLLTYATPEEVRQSTKETIHLMGKGGGYIVAPAQEVMPNVPMANVVALVETIRAEREAVLKA